jgi:hypothetical protein
MTLRDMVQDLVSRRSQENPSENPAPEGALPLGLSSIAISGKPRKIRGTGGITSHGRLRVKDAATLIESRAPNKTISFWTLTIPTGLEDSVHSHWARIVDNLRNELRDKLRAAGLPAEIVFVVEYQEMREEKYDSPALHLHILFQGKHYLRRPWVCNKKWCDECWRRTICNAIGNAGDKANWKAASRIETVYSTSAGYLGKYMSKGRKELSRRLDEESPVFIPHAWYGITKNLLWRVCRSIKTITGESAKKLISYLLANWSDVARFSRWACFPGRDGKPTWIAWYCDLRDVRGVIGLTV